MSTAKLRSGYGLVWIPRFDPCCLGRCIGGRGWRGWSRGFRQRIGVDVKVLFVDCSGTVSGSVMMVPVCPEVAGVDDPPLSSLPSKSASASSKCRRLRRAGWRSACAISAYKSCYTQASSPRRHSSTCCNGGRLQRCTPTHYLLIKPLRVNVTLQRGSGSPDLLCWPTLDSILFWDRTGVFWFRTGTECKLLYLTTHSYCPLGIFCALPRGFD